MAHCDNCGNFDASDASETTRHSPDYQPQLYYYWDAPLDEDYSWRDELPDADCLCEICFDILNSEKRIQWLN